MSDAVDLLRHRAVERAHAGLDVRDGDAGLHRGERAGERRVGVAVDEQRVGSDVGDQRLERGEHARGLRGVRAAADAEQVLGRRQLELVEEDLRQLGVVVLAGVDGDLLVRARAGGRRRRRP